MATGTITYAASVESVRFAPIEVSNPHPAVEKIIVETKDSEQIQVVFHLTDVFTDTEADAIAGSIVASLTNRLAFELDRGIGHPYLKGFSLPKDASGSSYTVSSSVPLLWNVAAPTITLGDERRQELARLLEQPLARPDLYSAYRFVVNQTDDVARFMFLYSILLQLQPDDNQKYVDDFIRREMPNVLQSPRPDKMNVYETLFTRLRNEIAHRRPGTTPERTRREIQVNVAAFQELVRTAISRAA
jgi:hypothetical protein